MPINTVSSLCNASPENALATSIKQRFKCFFIDAMCVLSLVVDAYTKITDVRIYRSWRHIITVWYMHSWDAILIRSQYILLDKVQVLKYIFFSGY